MWLNLIPPVLQELRLFTSASNVNPWWPVFLLTAASFIFCLGCCCGGCTAALILSRDWRTATGRGLRLAGWWLQDRSTAEATVRRSTVDDVLLEKSSNAAEKAESLRRELLEKLESVRGTRSALQNSLLHNFLSCGINKEEIGELTLDHPEVDKAMKHREREQTTDGHVYTSKIGLGYLTVNLGNFVRGRKSTLPKVYAEFIDELDDSGVGPMVKSLA